MMSTACLVPVSVPFHGDTIVCVEPDAAPPTIVLRRTCEAMGVDYVGQLNRLKRQSWATVSVMDIVAEDGKAREMVVIDRRTFAMWLATIDVTRLSNPEAVRKVTLYQCEAAEVLDRHFFKPPEPEPTGVELEIHRARQVVAILERQAEQERLQIEHDRRLTTVEAKADAALAIASGDTGYLSVLGYCNIHKIRLDRAGMASAGAALTKACEAAGVRIGKAPHEVYGKVNLYPIELLDRWAERFKVKS